MRARPDRVVAFMRWARILAVAVLAIAAGVIVVRAAFVAAYTDSNPERAAAVWPGHPTAVFRAGLIRIGEAAAAGRPVTGEVIGPLLWAARPAPLAPEPFLVRGVQLRVGGDEAGAGRAFAEAKRRDPRSIPARFFLADHHLRAGSVGPGLEEVASLTRLVPGSESRLAPVLAGYARTPGAAPQVKALLRAHPELEPRLLELLADDAGNANLILSLASRDDPVGGHPAWQARLVERLVSAGDYERAYALWARLVGRPMSVQARPLLFDPQFRQLTTMQPFAWQLESSGAGLVEPDQRGLHIIYYGRDNVSLASQLLLLGPGRHELAMRVAPAADGASSLSWTVRCLPDDNVIFSFDLAQAAVPEGAARRFDIPAAGCAAQLIHLAGTAPEFPQTVDLTLSQLRLSQVGR